MNFYNGGTSLASQPPFTHAERRGLVKCVKNPGRVAEECMTSRISGVRE